MDDVLIKFDDSLRIGNALLDSQHEELFRRANQIFMTPEEERGERIYDAMDFLRTYVLFHFDREESLMAAVAYEVSDEHKAAHGVFRDAVEDVWNRLEIHGYSLELFEKLQDLFAVRFVHHIQTMDRELALYVTGDSTSFD
jgi:hemerythrin